MKIYFRSYIRRRHEIIGTMVCIVAAIILNYILFQEKLNKISAQLENYLNSDYSIIYIINYAVPVKNICIFPDTDIQIFLDEQKQTRLSVSSIMVNKNTIYDEKALEFLNDLLPDQVALSKNVAKKYNIGSEEILYVEFPYSKNLIKLKTVILPESNYDYLYPNIDNDIGVVYLGYTDEYRENIQCKYALFSARSESEVLSGYPQIIASIIAKSNNENYVMSQGIHIIIFHAIFSIIAIVIAYLAFFSKSEKSLKRCFLKGMQRKVMIRIAFIEKAIFGIVPCVVTLYIVSNFIEAKSVLTIMYYAVPLIFWLVFSIWGPCKSAIRNCGKRG